MKSVGRIIRDTKALWRRFEEHRKERELIQAYKLVEAEYQRYVDMYEHIIEKTREHGYEREIDMELLQQEQYILKALQSDRKIGPETMHRCQVEATADVFSEGNVLIRNLIIKIAM